MNPIKNFHRTALILLSLAMLFTACYTAPPTISTGCTPGTYDEELTSLDQARQYRLHIPRSYQPGTPVPLLLGFHGAGSTGAQFESYSGFSALSEVFGYIAVYPQGMGELSNWDTLPNSQDVPFIRDLIDSLAARCNIDPARIYAAGHSRGGGMVNRLGCDLSDRLAAIAPVSGDYENSDVCSPSRPVPLVAFHGTADPVLPYNGFGLPGQIHESYTRIGTPVPAWAAAWAARNGCTEVSSMVFQYGPVTGQGWGNCDRGADVVLYTIQDGAHDWPTAVDPAQMIWQFFSKHPLSGP